MLVKWEAAVAMWKDYRWFGSGPGGYRSLHALYQKEPGKKSRAPCENECLHIASSIRITLLRQNNSWFFEKTL